MKRSWTLLAATSMLAACAGLNPRPATVQVWLTTGDKTQLLAQQPSLSFDGQGAAAAQIDVDAGQRFQSIVGFGASITDASAWLIH